MGEFHRSGQVYETTEDGICDVCEGKIKRGVPHDCHGPDTIHCHDDESDFDDQTLVEQATEILRYIESDPTQTLIPDGRVNLLRSTLAMIGPSPNRFDPFEALDRINEAGADSMNVVKDGILQPPTDQMRLNANQIGCEVHALRAYITGMEK